MRSKLHPIEVDPSNPFANDELNRRDTIENLSNIILQLETPPKNRIFSVNRDNDKPWGK